MSEATTVDVQGMPPEYLLTELTVDFSAEYRLSKYGTLGWRVMRAYEFEAVSETCDEVEDEPTVRDDVTVAVAFREAPKIDGDLDGSPAEDPFESLLVDDHLQKARRILRMVTDEEVDMVAIIDMFPTEVVAGMASYKGLVD